MCNFNNRQLTILFAVPNIQLFRERLSENVHATVLKGIVGGFEFTVLQRNLKELTRKAMKMCLRVLKESNKGSSTVTVVRNSVSIISHITFRDCRVHIFPTTFLEIAHDVCNSLNSTRSMICCCLMYRVSQG